MNHGAIRRLQGDDIGIVVDGKIVALRPVAVESTACAMREYGATAAIPACQNNELCKIVFTIMQISLFWPT